MGTTMRGACDDSREIYRIIKKRKKQNDYYCHVDGALSGFFMPFLESDLLFKAHVHSISISGHKFMGIPFPCGVFMMEKRFLPLVTTNVEYIGALDCMISGSRNGQASIFMKYIIGKKGYAGFEEDINRCIYLAEYLSESINEAWRNQNSITVVLPKPSDKVIKKWQLATEGDISHVVVMQHVTKAMLDEFIEDYKNDILSLTKQ